MPEPPRSTSAPPATQHRHRHPRDLHLALRYTDRALLLKNGATTALGPTHQTLSPHNISTVFEIDSELVFGV